MTSHPTGSSMNARGSTSGADGRFRPHPPPGPAIDALLVAVAICLGYLLIAVPNVELITFTTFAAGFVLGRGRGALVGALAMAVYSGINPYGSGLAVPSVYVAQVAATALAGFVGGVSRAAFASAHRDATDGDRMTPAHSVIGACIGFLLTLAYQSAVVLGLAALSLEFRVGLFAALAANALFSIVHLVSNTVIFAFLTPVVLPRLTALAARLGRRRRAAGRRGNEEHP